MTATNRKTTWSRLGSLFRRRTGTKSPRTRRAADEPVATDSSSEPLPTHRLAPPKNADGQDPTCRICYNKHGPLLPNHLIDPCDCKGELQYTHRRCLYNWMGAKPGVGPTKNQCEICKATIDAKTLLDPLRGDCCDEDAPVQIAFFPFFGKKNIALTM